MTGRKPGGLSFRIGRSDRAPGPPRPNLAVEVALMLALAFAIIFGGLHIIGRIVQ